jgi:hypothetical protein
MKLWLDDERKAPEGWTRAVSFDEAVYYAERHEIDEMSLDHDLGTAPICAMCEGREADFEGCEDPVECHCPCHRELAKTGYDFVKWLVETGKWPSTKPRVHSQNPVGRANMQGTIDRYWFNPKLN